MPPRPSNSRISSCGNFAASSSGLGGTNLGVDGPAFVWLSVGNPAFSRHSSHRPRGAPEARGLPQLGHESVISSSLATHLLPEKEGKVTDIRKHAASFNRPPPP